MEYLGFAHSHFLNLQQFKEHNILLGKPHV